MNGMELSGAFWEEVGLPDLKERFPQLLPCLAAGLVGEGSECFGYDDDISRDHDWGPGFCLWLPADMEARYGSLLREWYTGLPPVFRGWPRRQLSDRINVFTYEGFFCRFIGHMPESNLDWLRIPEEYLAVCTNGAVFYDPSGTFTGLLEHLRHQPQQVVKKKLAARCVTMMQAGQYNLPRCRERGEQFAAVMAVQDFLQAAASCVFLMNDRYMPFYKWMPRALSQLPVLGTEMAGLLEELAVSPASPGVTPLIGKVCDLIADRLRLEGYTDAKGCDMQQIGLSIYHGITDPSLKRLPVLAG